MIAAPSQRTVEDNKVDITILRNDTITTNVTDDTLRSNNGSDVNRLKRDASNEEVMNPLEIYKHKPKNKLQQRKASDNQAYKLSKLSNGYKIKINPSIPPLETWPVGIKRVPRSAADLAGKYEELTGNYPEEIRSHGDGEQTDFPETYRHHKRRGRTVMKLIPVERKDTKTYQVHELSDEGPNQESNVQRKPSINRSAGQVHKTTTSQNRHSQHTDPTTADEEKSSTGKVSGELSSNRNENVDDAITVFGHTSAPVQDGQNYREVEINGEDVRSRSAVGTELSREQGQDTSRHEPRTESDTRSQRPNYHHLRQNNSDKGEPIQANTQSDPESETNGSHRLREQTENRRETETDEYVGGDQEDGPEHVIASDEKGEMPFRSMPLQVTGTPESAELRVEGKAGYEGEGSDKDETRESDEEPAMNREQHEEERKSYEPPQLKYVMLDRNSQNNEYPTYMRENEDSMETKDQKEEVKDEEDEEEDGGGIYETLSKILEKKDAISRDEDVVGREDGEKKNKKQAESYHNYWVLEYSRPRFSK
jgi:hypothetical protein